MRDFNSMALNLKFLFLWCMLITCINTESQKIIEKRLLLTDPDYAANKQMQRDIQLLKATTSQLQTTVNALNSRVIGQDKHIQSQDRQIESQKIQIQNQDIQIQKQNIQIQSQTSVITTFQNSKCSFTIFILQSTILVYLYRCIRSDKRILDVYSFIVFCWFCCE